MQKLFDEFRETVRTKGDYAIVPSGDKLDLWLGWLRLHEGDAPYQLNVTWNDMRTAPKGDSSRTEDRLAFRVNKGNYLAAFYYAETPGGWSEALYLFEEGLSELLPE